MRYAFLLIFVYNFTFAQIRGTDSACTKINYPLPGTITTLSLTLQDNTYWGYISGNSLSKDKIKANYFAFDTSYSIIKGSFIEFGVATNESGTNPNIIFGLWKFKNKILDTTMFASVTIPLNRIVDDVKNNRETYFEFSTPIKVTESYLIGVKLPVKKGDTLALKSNKDNDTKPGTAWEQWSDDSWHEYSEPGCWYIDISNAIYPLTCSKIEGIGNYTNSRLSEDFICYPNPVHHILNISLKNIKNKNAVIDIYDITGRLLKSNTVKNNEVNPLKVDLSNFIEGVYFISLKCDNFKSTKKITVIK